MVGWSQANNLWTNRAAILCQSKFKQAMNSYLLFEIIQQHGQVNFCNGFSFA